MKWVHMPNKQYTSLVNTNSAHLKCSIVYQLHIAYAVVSVLFFVKLVSTFCLLFLFGI